METPQKRKLSAILFADIVGYTALMQSDKIMANSNLEKFHSTLNEKVALHQGRVINNYDDGCVCTFDSAVDTMREVHTIFQNVQNWKYTRVVSSKWMKTQEKEFVGF